MSSHYTRIVIIGSNMHVAVDLKSTSSTLKFHPVSRHTRSHIDKKRRT